MSEIIQQQEVTDSDSLYKSWMDFISLFQQEGGEDHISKWDVFAECFIRLSIEERSRFIDYSLVENEQIVDMGDEDDTMGNEGQSNQVSQQMIDKQIQIFNLASEQMDIIRNKMQEELVKY